MFVSLIILLWKRISFSFFWGGGEEGVWRQGRISHQVRFTANFAKKTLHFGGGEGGQDPLDPPPPKSAPVYTYAYD